VKDLSQLSSTDAARLQWFLRERLDDLDAVTALFADVLICGHAPEVYGRDLRDKLCRRLGLARTGDFLGGNGRVHSRSLQTGAYMRVKKAIIPSAGLGTRFLPATKAQPKEMLPVVDKPAIQYVVEEAVRAGLTELLIITGRGKNAIEDHFDRSFELEYYLEAKGKFDELKDVREISEMATIHYIRQRDPLGLGHAVAVAESFVSGEPFACLLGDDLITKANPLLEEMVKVHGRYGRSVLAVQEVARDEISLYGAIKPEFVDDNLARVVSIVEKPKPEEAPSNLAAIGRYILTPEIFDAIRDTKPGTGSEIQLTDAINLLATEQAVYAYVFETGRYDVGNKLDYLKATVELAIDRDDVGEDFRAYLADLVQRRKLL
jgi:UTP--glucose-1-phosphate uridylyltransferase